MRGLGDTATRPPAFGQIKPADIPDPGSARCSQQVFDGLLALKSGRAAEAVSRLENLPVVNSIRC